MIYSNHEINPGTVKKIVNLFPKQRGNVKVDNSRFPGTIIYICENGCKWRALPGTFGPRHTIYVRINRRTKNGVLERIFQALRKEQITNRRITVVSLDSSSARVHPDRRRTGRTPENMTRSCINRGMR
jgi:transposase